MLLLKLLVCKPLLETLVDLILSDIEHSFGVLAASLLQAPSRRVVKVKLAVDMAAMVTKLGPLEVVALLNIWVGGQSGLDRVSVPIEIALISCIHVIREGIFADSVA